MSSRIWLSCSSSCKGCGWPRGESTELFRMAQRGWGLVRLLCVNELTLLLSVLLIGLKISKSSIREESNLHIRESYKSLNKASIMICVTKLTCIPEKHYVSLIPGSFVHANHPDEYPWTVKSRALKQRNCVREANVNEVLPSSEERMQK